MDTPQQIFEVFNSDSSLSLNEFKIIERSSYYILIVPSTGAWATVSKTDIELISLLNSPKTISEFKKIEDSRRFSEIVDNLFYSGIIKINGKDITMINAEKKSNSDNTPSLLILKYTNACNLKCDYCYYYDIHFNNREMLPNEYVYKMVDLLKCIDDNRHCICFHGGEPLLRFNDITLCVSELKKKHSNIEFSIQTNGTLLTPSIADYLTKEEFSVGISIDGIDNETNILRPYANKQSSIQETLTAIDNCINAGVIPGVISVLTKKNCDRVIDIIDKLSSKGVKAFHFNYFFPGGRGANQEDLSVSIDKLLETKVKMLLYINDYNSKRTKEKHISDRHTRNMIRRMAQIDQLSYMCAQSPCGSGRKILTLVPNGDIYPCDDFSTEQLFRIGNVNTTTDLKQTLAESKAVKLCQSHSVENIAKCRNCVYKHLCISHCCSDSYHFTGKFNSPHSTCEFMQQYIPTVMDFLHNGRIQIENLIN